MSSELLLTFLVALIVFGPKKLPMLAQHLAKFFKQLNHLQQKLRLFWQAQLAQQQLQENIKKAQAADELYLAKKNESHLSKQTKQTK